MNAKSFSLFLLLLTGTLFPFHQSKGLHHPAAINIIETQKRSFLGRAKHTGIRIAALVSAVTLALAYEQTSTAQTTESNNSTFSNTLYNNWLKQLENLSQGVCLAARDFKEKAVQFLNSVQDSQTSLSKSSSDYPHPLKPFPSDKTPDQNEGGTHPRD